ncbi:hypothetical protein Tco_0825749 [Tanacetum coccineum]
MSGVGSTSSMSSPERFSLRRKCSKDPTEVSKIIRRTNETLPDFKERWTEEMGYIQGVPEVMQISAFMSNSKCPELARRFADQEINRLSLDSLIKQPKEILTTELQLQLPSCPPMVETLKKENLDKYCSEETTEEDNKGSINADLDGAGWVFRRTTDSDGKNRTECNVRKAHWHEGAPGYLLHNPCQDEVPTPRGIATLVARTTAIFDCRRLEEKQMIPERSPNEEAIKSGKESAEEELINLLKDNKDVFAWQPSDMVGVPRRIIQHSLNVNSSITQVAQKRRVLGSKKSKAVDKEVEEWVKAGIIRPVRYPTWISNPVLVKKVYDTWRMCIDFKNVNSACPKDYYPLPEIDLKIKAVMGFPFKCFLDAYKGYHQIQMSEEDEEKTAF